MTLRWFNIFNIGDFPADLFSKEIEFDFEAIGIKTVLITKGQDYSILYDGIMLMPNLNGYNPFAFDQHVAYIDTDNDLWLGVLVED